MNSSNPLDGRALQEAQQAAQALNLQLVALDARSSGELDEAVRVISHSRADALLISADLFLLENRAKIAQAARTAKCPAMFPWREYHEEHVLMSYGPDLKDAMHRLAASDLPIEQISKYDLVIDLHVAREQGIRVPQDLLLRADEVIR